ncbi:MAG: PilN domain-containing protein [Gemmatimonadaceae bacterium]
MIGAIGIALEASVLRAVYRAGGKFVATEMSWDPTRPQAAVDALSAEVGRVRTISLSIGLGFLETARPELPPLSDADRLRLLRRDADRYFPIEGAAAVTDARTGGVAFALASEQLQRWTAAFESWAPVRAIVAAPSGIASALAARGTSSSAFTIDAGAEERGVMRFANGVVEEARRVPISLTPGVVNGTRPIDDRMIEETPGRFAAAIGALDSIKAPLDVMLLDAPLDRVLRRQRQRRVWASYFMFAAMLVLLGTSVNLSRKKTLLEAEGAIAALTSEATPALGAQARLNSLNEEARVLLARQTNKSGTLAVLAALSNALPTDAFVQRLDWNGTEWHIDGSVNQGATIVPMLDAGGIFTNVRVLSASARFRDGDRMRESFSIAFQVKTGANAKR